MKTKFVILILIAGLLSACGSQPAETPASLPNEESAPTVETPANPPAASDTAIPPTEAPTAQPTTEPAATTGVSFANDILPVIQSRCINCHGGNKIEEGLSMKTYADLMAGSDNGPAIVPGDAAGSLLVELVSKQEMPKRGPKLTPPQVQLIVDWVNQGALDN